MKYFRVFSVIILSMLLVSGCGDDDKKDSNNQLATGSGTTNTSGQTTFSVGSYSVTVTVQDTASTGLPSINVTGYLAQNNILLIAQDPTSMHYPVMSVTGLSALAKVEVPGHIQSPDEVDMPTVNDVLTMYEVQLAAHSTQVDPAGLDAIIAGDRTNEACAEGVLDDIFNVVDTIQTYHQGFFVHLSQGVATAVSAPVRTAVFMPGEIDDYATFLSLVGLMFHLYEGDSLNYCMVSYSNTRLPLFFINNATIANRNFWAQFTLIWGAEPRDLDSHLWAPTFGNGSYEDSLNSHVFYARPGSQNDPPYAELDVDDQYSYGPEHITIYQSHAGIYTYSVHHYAGDSTLATSGASVSLLKPDGTVQSFSVPTDTAQVQTYWYWNVCTIDGTTGVVTPINTFTENPPGVDFLLSMPAKPEAEAKR